MTAIATMGRVSSAKRDRMGLQVKRSHSEGEYWEWVQGIGPFGIGTTFRANEAENGDTITTYRLWFPDNDFRIDVRAHYRTK